MSNNSHWEPILFHDTPITESSVEDTTPSFCDSALPQEFEGTGTPTTPPQPQTSDFQPSTFPSQPIPPVDCSPGGFSVQQPDSSKVRSIRPYDVAAELMMRLPLRMVDNALYAYDGRVFRFVSAPVMNRLIMEHCRRYVQAVGDAGIIERVYKIIQAEPRITYKPPRQAEPFVAVADGLVDLRTLTLRPFSPAPFVTVQLNGNFSHGANAPAPTFSKFLYQISGGDNVWIERAWQAIGYALVPDNRAKCFILLQGVPDSGKSLFGSIVEALVDEDLVTSLDLTALGERFGPSELVGKQLCTALDLPSGALDPKSVSLLKSLTGGDTVSVDVKYQPRIKFRCQTTFILATNHAFLTRDNDPALFRRVVVLPFRHTVSQAHQDRNLRELILRERDAIIYRALQAYGRLVRCNFCFAGHFAVNEVFSGERSPQQDLRSMLWTFCRSCCIPSAEVFTTTSQLYDSFFRVSGIAWPGGINQFSAEITGAFASLFPNAGITKDRKRVPGKGGNPERGFVGVALQQSQGVVHHGN